ncbi:response regulator [Sulfitobacter sp. LCG007]
MQTMLAHSTAVRPQTVRNCLIIDDSDFDRRRLSRMVKRGFPDFTVSCAATLAEARGFLVTHGATLILLDNQLPDGVGANFALELASDIRFCRTPVILVTDFASPFMYDKAQKAGVAHIVAKSDFGLRYIHDALRSRKHRPATVH